jgi:hypothetical protein
MRFFICLVAALATVTAPAGAGPLPYAAAVYSPGDGGLWIVARINIGNSFCYRGEITYNSTMKVYTVTAVKFASTPGCLVGKVDGYAAGFFSMSSAPARVSIALPGRSTSSYRVGKSMVVMPWIHRGPPLK